MTFGRGMTNHRIEEVFSAGYIVKARQISTYVAPLLLKKERN